MVEAVHPAVGAAIACRIEQLLARNRVGIGRDVMILKVLRGRSTYQIGFKNGATRVELIESG